MDISSLSGSASSLISSAQNKAAGAAQAIASIPVQKQEVGGSTPAANDLFKPVLSLKEAELENSAGVKLLSAERQTIGSLLDIRA